MTQTSRDLQKVDAESASSVSKEKITLLSQLQRILSNMAQFLVSHYWLVCVIIGAIAMGFNLYRLGSISLWFDEILSVGRARESLPILIRIIMATAPNMALYYIILHFWLSLTTFLGLNPTEFVVRFPSTIFAALSSVMVFLLGRRYLGPVAGIVAAGIYLLNDVQLIYAQDTRSYSLQLLLICLSWYALFAVFAPDSHRRRWWVCYTIVTVLAVYTQLFSALVLAAQVVAFAGLLILPTPWRDNVRQQWRGFAVSLISIVIASIPLIYASRHGSRTGWLPIPHPWDIYLLFLNISANSRIYLALITIFSCLGLCVALLVYPPKGIRLLQKFSLIETKSIDDNDSKHALQLQQLWPIGFALICWILVPIILSYVISQSSLRLFSNRYLVTIVPPLVLLVGMGILVLRWRVVQIVLTLSLFLLALHYVPLYYQNAQVEDWSTASHWLEQYYQTNDGLVCYDNAQGCQISIEYYLTAYPSAAHFTPDSPGTFSREHYDLTNHIGNTEQAADPRALAVFGAHHPRIFYIIGRISTPTTAAHAKSAIAWLDTHYHFVAQIVTPTVTIRLYETR